MAGPIDFFIVAGQSNAEGRGDKTLSPAVTGASLVWKGTTLAALVDPVGGANTGSAWPAFANAYEALSGVPVCISESATGGTALLRATGSANGDWSPQGTLLDAAVTKALNGMAALVTAGWTPTLRGILWHQGESDAANNPNQSTLTDDYSAALVELRRRFMVGLNTMIRLYVFRVGRPYTADTLGYMRVRAAQDDACEAAGDLIHMVYRDCVNFPARGWMSPDPAKRELHYSQAGYNNMGAVGGAIVATLVHSDFRVSTDGRDANMFGVDRSPLMLETP